MVGLGKVALPGEFGRHRRTLRCEPKVYRGDQQVQRNPMDAQQVGRAGKGIFRDALLLKWSFCSLGFDFI